jgi:hypothetical protein
MIQARFRAPHGAIKTTLLTAALAWVVALPALAQDDGHGHGDGDGHGHGDEGKVTDVPDLPPGEGPRLVWEFGSDSHDFGNVMQGEVLQHTFVLKSGGTEDLVIKQAKPTCGCTVADVLTENGEGGYDVYQMGSPIPVGRQVKIAATLQTKGKNGHASSRINIFSNDPRGQRQLGLAAEVETFFQVTPTHISFRPMSTKDTAEDKAVITTTRGEPIKLEMRERPTPAGVSVALKPENPDENGRARRWMVEVKAGPGLHEGNMSYTVALVSDVPVPGAEALPDGTPATYDVNVTVMGRVNGMISVNPSLISLGLVRPGQVASRTVRIDSHDPAFEIGEPKVRLVDRQGEPWDLAEHFTTILRPVAGENAVDVELRLDGLPDTLNSSFSGMLVIETGHPDKPEVELPISGVCRGGVQRPSTGGGGVVSTGGGK